MSERTRTITDLALAAFLAATGHKLHAVRGGHGRGLFVFAETPALTADILHFYNREARVDPLAFAEMLRNLKAAAVQIA